MVAITRGALEEITRIIAALKCGPYYTDREVRIIANGKKLSEIKTYWILDSKKTKQPLSGIGIDGKKYLLVFSEKKKAKEFLKNIGRKPTEFYPCPLTWEEVIGVFLGEFEYAGLDDMGLGEKFLAIPIKV